MFRLLFALMGYVYTAAVIAIALGAVHLFQSGQLDGHKTFPAVAFLHDIDLNKMASVQYRGNARVIPRSQELLDELLALRR